ncbi:hypothetical protein HMPREF1556_00921 [Porphyromonas sp. oral taxon 278 str. W7784]|nr:hypothetical protein HMPREF1556_00921 [Porphyromonas sp. oral taxon 278 str. W7784]
MGGHPQREQKRTYGRSLKKPTVGRDDDPLWVAKATYRRSHFGGAGAGLLLGLFFPMAIP